MNKKMLVALISGVLVCAVTVTASSSMPATPLYMVRMEQVSSTMNFLPTEVNGFTYAAEKGYTVDYDGSGYYGGTRDVTTGRTCEGTCIEPTCPHTCWSTCGGGSTCEGGGSTCGDTCPNTCGATCYTCDQTCDTCPNTCIGNTCNDSCTPPTCVGPNC